MDYVKTYLIEVGKSATLRDFIKSTVVRTGLQNIEGALFYSRIDDIGYMVLQRTAPLPEHMKCIPEASSFGTELLMVVKPSLTEDERRQIVTARNAIKHNLDYNEKAFLNGLTYHRFNVDLTQRGAETITDELVNQVKAELEGK